MKKILTLVAAASLFLSGCATTLRSNVTAFNDWPADLPDKSYVFDTPAPAEDTLEYRSYLGLLNNELARLLHAGQRRGHRQAEGRHALPHHRPAGARTASLRSVLGRLLRPRLLRARTVLPALL